MPFHASLDRSVWFALVTPLRAPAGWAWAWTTINYFSIHPHFMLSATCPNLSLSGFFIFLKSKLFFFFILFNLLYITLFNIHKTLQIIYYSHNRSFPEATMSYNFFTLPILTLNLLVTTLYKIIVRKSHAKHGHSFYNCSKTSSVIVINTQVRTISL